MLPNNYVKFSHSLRPMFPSPVPYQMKACTDVKQDIAGGLSTQQDDEPRYSTQKMLEVA